MKKKNSFGCFTNVDRPTAYSAHQGTVLVNEVDCTQRWIPCIGTCRKEIFAFVWNTTNNRFENKIGIGCRKRVLAKKATFVYESCQGWSEKSNLRINI